MWLLSLCVCVCVCVCVFVCLLIGACGRRCLCMCVNVYLACRTIVGRQSENPRSCWKEMIGFTTRWPLCDRWLGAGLAELKSPTLTYVGSHKPEHTHTHTVRKACKMSTHVCMWIHKRVWGLYLYTYLCNNIKKSQPGTLYIYKSLQISKHIIMTLKETGIK